MALSESPLQWVLGIGLFIASMVEFNVASIAILENNITPFATWIFVGAIFGAYLLSQRSIGELSDWEMGAFVVGLGGYAMFTFVDEVATLISEYQPHSGIVMVVAIMAAFYVLTNENI